MIYKLIIFIVSSIITSYFTDNKFNPVHIYKRLARRKYLKQSYIHKNDIVFGTPQYDFFDHEDKAYLSELIQISIVSNQIYQYNFDQSFDENCRTFPKLKEISNFITNNPYLKDLNINNIINEEIVPNLEVNEETVYIVHRITKSRRDKDQSLEAGTLKIEMIRTNVMTAVLIDELYQYLYKLNPDIMEMHFKKNILKDAEYREPYDIICFMTSLIIQGYVIEKNSKGINFLIHNNRYFSYEIKLTEKLIDLYHRNYQLNGGDLKQLIEGHLKQNNITGVITNTKFTDIAISYEHGIHGEVLSTVVMDNLQVNDGVFSISLFTDNYYAFRNSLNKGKTSFKKEFAYLYIWSIIRKAKYKHL